MKSESDQIQQILDDYSNNTNPDDLQEKRLHDQEERQKLRNVVAHQSNEIQLLKVSDTITVIFRGGVTGVLHNMFQYNFRMKSFA